ncbi:MAG: sulfotransferase [Cyanobacteria bacterium J06639_1]
MKIVGIGLNKTGTSTLGVCFKHWGLEHVSVHHDAFKAWQAERFDDVVNIARQYDSFEDWPWPLVYQQLDRAYPGSKFVLTKRKDPQTWYKSLCKHAQRTGPTELREVIYGFAMPQQHQAEHIEFYNAHLQSVRDYFRDRPQDLLEICWEEGDGWPELADFLGLEDPGIPLPHANPCPAGVQVRRKQPSPFKRIRRNVRAMRNRISKRIKR